MFAGTSMEIFCVNLFSDFILTAIIPQAAFLRSAGILTEREINYILPPVVSSWCFNYLNTTLRCTVLALYDNDYFGLESKHLEHPN